MKKKRNKKTLWQKLGFKEIPVCEECKKEPATSFSFFNDPLELQRVDKLKKENPEKGKVILTGGHLDKLINGPRELAEAIDKEMEPYIPKMLCKLTGNCTTQTESYFVQFDKFFKTPTETVSWLAHLDKKGWVNWNDFMRAIRRLKKMIG